MIKNTPFHSVCFCLYFFFCHVIDFVYISRHTLTNFVYTSHFIFSCLYQSLCYFVYTSHKLLLFFTSHQLIVYRVHQRPRGGERLAGRYNAEERFLRLLRLSRCAGRVRFVGTSREGRRSPPL